MTHELHIDCSSGAVTLHPADTERQDAIASEWGAQLATERTLAQRKAEAREALREHPDSTVAQIADLL